QIGPRVGDIFASPISRLWRQRSDRVFFDAYHFHLVQIHHHDHAVDGPRVAIVVRLGPDETERAQSPDALVFSALGTVHSSRPRVHHHQASIHHTAFLEGLMK